MQFTAQLLAELLDRHGAALKLYARQSCAIRRRGTDKLAGPILAHGFRWPSLGVEPVSPSLARSW